MAYTPLRTDFKDDILDSSNYKRKYKQVANNDGTFSLQDETTYQQVGSDYGAKEVNEEREAINNVYASKLVTLDEIDLVTEEGFFVDALAVKELNSKLTETTAGLSKANNSLGVIGTQYFGKTASYSYRNANNWVNNVAKVTLPKGTYIFTITAKPQALGQNLDAFTLGITGVSWWEAQSTSLFYFGSGFYPTCTHTFVASVNAGTYGLAIWSSHNRTVNDVEIMATRIK